MPQRGKDETDLILIEDDEATTPLAAAPAPWRLLVVDDDDEVHRATRFALKGIEIDGRPVALLHALSAREGEAVLRRERDIACMLLDVVMETPASGLDLVEVVRRQLGNHMVRIILRTGQPGQAPELDVVQRYDINDYKHKAELDNTRLLTALTSACRSYRQLCALEASRRGLGLVVEATRDMMAETALAPLASGLLARACALLGAGDGTVCLRSADDGGGAVLAATGRHRPLAGRPVGSGEGWGEGWGPGRPVLTARLPSGDCIEVRVEHTAPLPEMEQRLMEVLASNATAALSNAELFERVERMAFRDPLTGLPNRASFGEEIQRRIADGRAVVVAIADLDRFHAFNGGLGPELGDRLLQIAARLLGEAAAAQGGFVARLYSDVFGLILPADDRDQADAALAALQLTFREPLEIGGHSIYGTFSIGAALHPRHGDNERDLIRGADMALRQAKAAGHNQVRFFASGMGREVRHRLEMIGRLRRAFSARELKVFLQPQVRLDSGACVGGEALLRWPLPGGGFIPPTEFVAAAEDSGLIHDIGGWALAETCRWLARWADIGRKDLRAAFNVSPVQFRQPDFRDQVLATVDRAGIDPALLELEITESCLLDDREAIALQLGELRERGMRIALDDFGTGYSSLSRLRRLPIDTLKIDRSFIIDMTDNADDRNIAETIVRMGHLLGKEVVAEGVETRPQADALRAMGCQLAQGYLFSPAVPAEDFERLVA